MSPDLADLIYCVYFILLWFNYFTLAICIDLFLYLLLLRYIQTIQHVITPVLRTNVSDRDIPLNSNLHKINGVC